MSNAPHQRHRSFSTADTPKDPITFDIDGIEFACHAIVPGTILMRYAGVLDQGMAVAGPALVQFFADVMEAEEYARFRAHVDDPGRSVDANVLADILGYVMEEYAGRPTRPSASSTPGARRTITGSPDGSSNLAAVPGL